jgi:hypothetical protein
MRWNYSEDHIHCTEKVALGLWLFDMSMPKSKGVPHVAAPTADGYFFFRNWEAAR